MNTYGDISKALITYANNPGAMQTIALNQLRGTIDNPGVELLQPTDPVAFLCEMGVILGHACIESERNILSTLYPSMATTSQDLYRHMSDYDFIDVFAVPTEATFSLFLDVESLKEKAIPLNGTGNRSLIIPRDTYFKVSGYIFTIQYPIEIILLPYGSYKIMWLTDTLSPIKTITSNLLDWGLPTTPFNESRMIKIDIPAMQYKITSHSDVIMPNTGWVRNIKFTDKFYYARVFYKSSDTWTEIKTTHSKYNYDVITPTAVLVAGDGILSVKIPEVYINGGLISGDIRVDIYSTKGELDLNLGNYNVSDFSFSLQDLNEEINENYVNPLNSFSVSFCSSSTILSGGRDQLTFRELKERLIENAVGVRKLPITEKQLAIAVSDKGLTLTKAIDYVTGRIYHLSSSMPVSTMSDVSSAIGTTSKPLYFSWDDLTKLSTVKVNNDRLTITNDTFYTTDGSRVYIDSSFTDSNSYLTANELVTIANANKYLWTPFHYVMDRSDSSINTRVYNLSTPELSDKKFIENNETTLLDVITGTYEIKKDDSNYIIRLVTKSGNSYKNLSTDLLFAQISFLPTGYTKTRASINGELIGSVEANGETEYVWEFILKTNLDIDKNHEMIINNLALSEVESTNVPIALQQEIDIVYGCKGYYPSEYVRGNLDDIIRLPTRDSIGISHEKLTLKLGDNLEYLWAKSRPVTDSYNYEHYEEDVYQTYTKDIIERDSNGVIQYDIDTTNNKVTPKYLHKAGEYVLDEAGDKVILYQRGTIKKDENGNPIIANLRSIQYRCVMCLFDARYRLATTTDAINYLNSVVKYVVNMITNVIPELKDELIELTNGYYKPETNMGYVTVRKSDGSSAPVYAELTANIDYYLTAANRRDKDLLVMIRNKTRKIISDYYTSNSTISATEIGDLLNETLNDSIISVEVGSVGVDNSRVITVLDDSSSVALAKTLEVQADGNIAIVDNLNITFNRHDTTK